MFRAALLGGFLASVIALGVGCGEDGETADCPPLPLYDGHVVARRESLRPELTAAADAGCITLPKGFDTAHSGGSSGSGEGGVDGEGGVNGEGGSGR